MRWATPSMTRKRLSFIISSSVLLLLTGIKRGEFLLKIMSDIKCEQHNIFTTKNHSRFRTEFVFKVKSDTMGIVFLFNIPCRSLDSRSKHSSLKWFVESSKNEKTFKCLIDLMLVFTKWSSKWWFSWNCSIISISPYSG